MNPVKIGVVQNGSYTLKNLWEIFDPNDDNHFNQLPDEQSKIELAIRLKMFPTEVKLSSETYCRDAERTANYELEKITNVNAKAKPEFTWAYLKKEYVQNLLTFLGFKYDYAQTINNEQVIVPEEAKTIMVQYWDFIGTRTIKAYLGANMDGTLVCYEENGDYVGYWENFRIAFPER